MRNPFDNADRRAFRETVARFVKQEIEPNADAWDESGEVPWAVHEQACGLGLFGFGIDERYGGLGFDDAFMRLASAEELGHGGVGGVVAAIGSRSIMVGPLATLADEAIKLRALPAILSGRKGGALGITEPSGGSDVASMQTRAVRDGEYWRLSGTKTFITGGMNASHFVIAARTGEAGLGGISLFFVDADTAGFTRTALARKMGWWSSDTATLYFDDCRIPASHLMGEENRRFLAIMNNFNYERLFMCGQMLGMSRRVLEESIAYAGERRTFGKPLIEHQVIRHKIADMSSRIDAMEALLNQICWCVNEGEMQPRQVGAVREVERGMAHATPARRRDGGGDVRQFGGAARDQMQVATLAGEHFSCHPADALGRAGDERALAGQSEIHGGYLSA